MHPSAKILATSPDSWHNCRDELFITPVWQKTQILALCSGIPRLVFLIDRSHPILFSDVDQGEGAAKLQALKDRMQEERVVNYFVSPWATAYYERKRAEGKSHSVAVRALSNVWVRIIFAMLNTHTPYVSAIFETARTLHAVKAA